MSDHLLRKRPSSSASPAPPSSRPRHLFSDKECLFCEKPTKYLKGNKKETLTQCVTKSAMKTIISSIKEKEDWSLLSKVGDRDLIAFEAMYHNSCRKAYTRSVSHKTTSNISDDDGDDDTVDNINDGSLKHVYRYIDEKVITNNQIVTLTNLIIWYKEQLSRSNTDTKHIRPSRVKTSIMLHYGDNIKFYVSSNDTQYIYSSNLTVNDLIESSYQYVNMDTDEIIKRTASIIRSEMSDFRQEPTEPTWPPTVEELVGKMNSSVPKNLELLLTVLISGKPETQDRKQMCQVNSIAQDVLYCCNKFWNQMPPKHQLLAITVHHLVGSKQLVQVLNRFGHCVTYNNVLEIETAFCEKVQNQISLIPPAISIPLNDVLLFCFDNFDLNEETPTGAGTTHTTHGIIIQQKSVIPQDAVLTEDLTPPPPILPPQSARPKKPKSSLIVETKELPPCYVKKQAEPPKSFAKFEPTAVQSKAVQNAKSEDILWILCRHFSSEKQVIPGWAGWVSMTGLTSSEEPRRSTIEYLQPIMSPITENATVYECIDVALNGTREVGQAYPIITMDLAAAKKALNIVWQTPRFSSAIVLLGGFHLVCAYLSALGKFISHSGFEEVLLQSGICASGSIDAVIRGKHYNRALSVHKAVYEATMRLLLNQFFEEYHVTGSVRTVLQSLSTAPSRELLVETLKNQQVEELLESLNTFMTNIRDGRAGKTPQFWLQYADCISYLLLFIRATKENNFDLHVASYQPLLDTFFAFDHHNYSRFTTYQYLTLLNIETTHPGAEELLRKNGLSVARSAVPCSRNMVDMTIEQTINCTAKTKGGIIGFSRNAGAYRRWCVSRSERAAFTESTLEWTGLSGDSDDTNHRDLTLSNIKSSEDRVQAVMVAIESMINPFTFQSPHLVSISTGVSAPKDVQDLVKAMEKGSEAKDDFIKTRLIECTTDFFTSSKKLKIPTFTSGAVKSKLTTSENKKLELSASRNLFGQLLNLTQSYNLDIEKMFTYSLSPVPWSLSHPDGSLVKTPKSVLAKELEKGVQVLPSLPSDTVHIIDGNMLFHQIQTPPPTFGELALHLFRILPKTGTVHFCTDSYKDKSIKDTERERRGRAEPIMIGGPNTKTPKSWKDFLKHSVNKENLISFLLQQWKTKSFAKLIQGRKLYFSNKGVVELLTTDGAEVKSVKVQELESTHEEADTKIMLHLMFQIKEENKPVVVRSVDTDVFLILLHYAHSIDHKIIFDTGMGDKRRLLDIHDVAANLDEGLCEAILAFHAFTGSDSTSAFLNKGKINPLKLMKKEKLFLNLFSSIGNNLDITAEIETNIEAFTCKMYSRLTKTTDVNRLRYLLFQTRFSPKDDSTPISFEGVDIATLPPCRDCLLQHVKRVNYQTYIWKHAHQANPIVPSPTLHGWMIYDESLAPEWSKESFLPTEIVDILYNEAAQQSDNTDDE